MYILHVQSIGVHLRKKVVQNVAPWSPLPLPPPFHPCGFDKDSLEMPPSIWSFVPQVHPQLQPQHFPEFVAACRPVTWDPTAALHRGGPWVVVISLWLHSRGVIAGVISNIPLTTISIIYVGSYCKTLYGIYRLGFWFWLSLPWGSKYVQYNRIVSYSIASYCIVSYQMVPYRAV